jgi:hypothetical protein
MSISGSKYFLVRRMELNCTRVHPNNFILTSYMYPDLVSKEDQILRDLLLGCQHMIFGEHTIQLIIVTLHWIIKI